MLFLMPFLDFRQKNQGGGGCLTCRKIAEPLCLLVPLISQSFIQIEEIVCITPAWFSGKRGLDLLPH